MTESNAEAQLKAACSEGIAAVHAYKADVAQEQAHAGRAQASRDSAIANVIRYGAALRVGRAIHATDDNAFHGWTKHTGLDLQKPFDDRRERSAAMQMAEIAGDGSAVVTPFAGCPHSRPTHCMRWFRAQQEEAEIAKREAERQAAQEAERERQALLKDTEPDPLPMWLKPRPPLDRGDPNRVWPKLTEARAEEIGERARSIARSTALTDICTNFDDRTAIERLSKAPHEALSSDRSVEGLLEQVEAERERRWPTRKPKPSTPRAPVAPEVQERADSAEIATLKKELAAREQELWAARDKLDQLSMFLVDKPQPMAEERPVSYQRAWPLHIHSIKRPKEVGKPNLVSPGAEVINDPAFALRREEFEQWLVRRREDLERHFMARRVEEGDKIEARIKDRVEREIAKGRVFSEKQFNAIVRVLHPDSRKAASEEDLNAAFDLIWTKRDILVVGAALKAKMKAKHAAAAAQAAAEGKPPPPKPEEPDRETLGEALARVRAQTRH